jgi:hypothetical protein
MATRRLSIRSWKKLSNPSGDVDGAPHFPELGAGSSRSGVVSKLQYL